MSTPSNGQDALVEAAREVLSFREGDLPGKGWLRDNGASRAALGRLAAALASRAPAEAVQAGEWRPATDAPDGWHPTYRLGEKGSSWAAVKNHVYADGDGYQEWFAPDGRTTVTHSTYAEPTHYLHVDLPPIPAAPDRAMREDAPGAEGDMDKEGRD